MKLQQNPNLNLNRPMLRKDLKVESNKSYATNKDVNFKGIEALGLGFTQFLRTLDTSPAWGAIFVDLAFMDSPRTIVDFTRGPSAGLETARREGSGTANHSLIGTYGVTAASLLALGVNSKYGIHANKIFASDETWQIAGNNYHNLLHKNAATTEAGKKVEPPTGEFFKQALSELQGFALGENGKYTWKGFDNATVDELSEKMKQYALSGDDSKKARVNLQNYVKAKFGASIGSESQLRLNKDAKDVMDADTFVENITKIAKAFRSKKVQNVMLESVEFSKSEILRSIKHLNTKVAVAGLGIAAGIGACIQPVNMYLTKKKTGSSAFVGGGEPDKSNGFKILKGAAAAAFWAGAFATIATKPAKFLSELQFKGLVPTIAQFKFIYGMTIASRFLAARNKDELRESSIKDSLGFVNWLILGSFVSKLAAMGFEKWGKLSDNKYIKAEEKAVGEGAWNKTKAFMSKLINSSIVSRDEVLYAAVKKAKEEGLNIETIKDGKALKFGEIMKLLPKDNAIINAAKTKIKYLNVIQMVGYVYSAAVLGIGIPKLNIAITTAIRKKREAKKAAQSATQTVQTQPAAQPQGQQTVAQPVQNAKTAA